MRLLFLKLLIIILPLGCMVIATNYCVDPANVFSSSTYLGGIAGILTKGHNVENLFNYDGRLLQEQMVKKLHENPDVVVIGSSRVMEIGSGFFPGKKVLNCGVSHGWVRDIVAIVGLFDSLGRLPKEFVIGLDPYMIGAGGSSEWQSLSAYYGYYLRKTQHGNEDHTGGWPNSYRKISSLFSFDYFKSSLEFVVKRRSKKYWDAGLDTPSSGRFSDGTISYPATYRNPDTLKVGLDARNAGLRDGLPQPDPVNTGLLNQLLDFLQQRQIAVKFIMVPFHPEFYEAVNQHQPLLFHHYEQLFIQMSEKRNIPIVGGFDPEAQGIPRLQFYDMFHCSKEALHKVFNNPVSRHFLSDN